MSVSPCRIFVEILFLISLSKSEDLCLDEEESDAVERLGASLGINSFTFVQERMDVGVLEKLRRFPGRGLLSLVIDSAGLEEIWSDEYKKSAFFEERTILVVKEELNLSRALEKLSGLQSVTWAVFLKSPGDIKTAYIPLNVNFFAVQCTSNAITINRIYHIRRGLPLSVKNIQKWETEEMKGLYKTNRSPSVNFGNATLNFLFLHDEEECKEVTHILHKIECYHHEIVGLIGESLNASINEIQSSEKYYPYNYPNGSYSEMFFRLQSGEADVSSGSYIVSKSRMENYDFAWPVFTTRSMMYIKYESVKSRWRAYLRPIENNVWNAIVSWILITGFLLQFFEESRRPSFKFTFSLIPAFIKSVFLSLQVFCNQGVQNVPKWNSSRIVFMLSFVLFVALYEAYSAFLISSLTVAIPNIPFTSLDGFLNDGTYKMMTLQAGFHSYFIRKTLHEYGYKPANILQDEAHLPDTTQMAIDLICKGEKLTYIEFRENIVRNHIRCKILELPKSIFIQNIGLGLQKNSPFKTILTQQITVLRSSGILYRMRRNLLSFVTLQERDTSDEEYIQVTVWHVISVFSIIVGGMVLSLIIFLLEVYIGFSKYPKVLNKKTGRRRTLKIKHLKWKYSDDLPFKKMILRRNDSNITGGKLK